MKAADTVDHHELVSTASALWYTSAHSAELRQMNLSAPGPNEVQIKTLYSGISRGTETLVFAGEVPVSEHERMRAPFQEGDFNFPLKYGYINIGVVEHGPEHLRGKTVFTLFPHQTHFNIAIDATTVIPDEVPAQRAVLTANMETAINALWDANPCIGDTVSVVGAGVLGCLVAWLARGITGCAVQLVDINDERAAIAQKLGIQFARPQDASRDRDLVIHTSASSEGLNTALDLAGFEATLIELSWFGTRAASVNLGEAFHSRRLQIKSSQVGHIAPCQRARWSYKRRLEFALKQLADPQLDILISSESAYSSLPDTLHWLSTEGKASLCHRIKYD